MYKIQQIFKNGNPILSVFFTAGFPKKETFKETMLALQDSGVDMIEIGMPFSDPIADGPTIQQSNDASIRNGFTLNWLFSELHQIKEYINIPYLLMGYLNPVVQFGFDQFVNSAAGAGVSGLILPDLPIEEYKKDFKKHMEKNGLANVFLISPQTSETRVREIDELSNSFIYMVSTAGITGARSEISDAQKDYFKRIQHMKLHNPLVAGFGISNRQTFNTVCEYVNGAIIGSAYINVLSESKNITSDTKDFIQAIR